MYTINENTGEIIFPDGAKLSPPYNDPRYSEYAAWVLAGNQPTAINTAPDVTVTALQAKTALAMVGLYDDVEAYILQDTTDRITKLKWEYSNFRRYDPAVLEIAAALELSDQELDSLFQLANSIE